MSTRITISAHINKPVAHVWKIWTEPEHIMQWNAASDDWHCPKASNDLRTGRKFRRPHSIDGHVLDFYCPTERLAVELDGAIHRDPTRSMNDQERDERLRTMGIRVLRFTNDQVYTSLQGVLEDIAAHFKK